MVGKTAFPMGITLHGERNSNFLLIENALRSAGISFIEKNPPSELPFAGTALIIGPRPQLNP
jgi:hypothetical protein